MRQKSTAKFGNISQCFAITIFWNDRQYPFSPVGYLPHNSSDTDHYDESHMVHLPHSVCQKLPRYDSWTLQCRRPAIVQCHLHPWLNWSLYVQNIFSGSLLFGNQYFYPAHRYHNPSNSFWYLRLPVPAVINSNIYTYFIIIREVVGMTYCH